LEKTGSTDNKIRLLNISNNKPQQNLKIINNEKNKIQNLSLTNNKTLQRLKYVKFKKNELLIHLIISIIRIYFAEVKKHLPNSSV